MRYTFTGVQQKWGAALRPGGHSGSSISARASLGMAGRDTGEGTYILRPTSSFNQSLPHISSSCSRQQSQLPHRQALQAGQQRGDPLNLWPGSLHVSMWAGLCRAGRVMIGAGCRSRTALAAPAVRSVLSPSNIIGPVRDSGQLGLCWPAFRLSHTTSCCWMWAARK